MGDGDGEGREPAIRPASRGERALTRADLAGSLYREIGLSHKEAVALVESVLEEIANALSHGEAVKLSSFGTFTARKKKQRMGRNPKTGEEVQILPRKVLVFRGSRIMKDRINRASGC